MLGNEPIFSIRAELEAITSLGGLNGLCRVVRIWGFDDGNDWSEYVKCNLAVADLVR